MIYLSSINNGRIMYDFKRLTSLECFYAGTTDYYFRMVVYSGGKIEDDNTLMFIIDKSNMGIYNTLANFFDAVKTVALTAQAGEKKVKVDNYPFLHKNLESNKPYDLNELYDQEKKRIKWLSEAGDSMFNLNAKTIMFIEAAKNEFRIIFKKDDLSEINKRYPRNVCVCNSGSNSDVFPALCWAFDQELRKLPIMNFNDEILAKMLIKGKQ